MAPLVSELGYGEGESTMKILGKQSLPAASSRRRWLRIWLSGHFRGGRGTYPAIPAIREANAAKFIDTRCLRISR
jgi:hypothetical protein